MIWDEIAREAARGAFVQYTVPEPGRIPLERLLEDAEGTARAMAAALPSDGQLRIGLLMANGEPWLRVFLAATRLGAVAVPLAIPAGFRGLEAYNAHIARIAKDAQLDAVIFDDLVAAVIPGLQTGSSTTRFIHHAALTADARHPVLAPTTAEPGRLAVLQYTSGSTSAPKGVMLTEGNILAGLRPISYDTDWDPDTDSVGVWIPLFHDMGLFGTLAGLVRGSSVCLWTPTEFVKRPLQWLKSFAASQASILPAPNFFFDYLTAAAADAPDAVAGLDLSSWRIAFNGSEHVRWQTIESFTERFGPHGFRPATMFPVYGLAEATLPVTFPRIGELPRKRDMDRAVLGAGSGSRTVTCVGRAVSGIELRIEVDPGAGGSAVPGKALVGEVQVRGKAVTSGYLNLPASEQPFTADGWLKTGDLGFLDESGLYITGRAKDMIAVNGENYYAEDVEEIVRASPLLDRRHCAAVPWTDEGGRDAMLVLVETARTGDDAEKLAGALRDDINGQLGLAAVQVRALPPKSLPYTSSGKIRRRQVLADLEPGEMR